MDINKIIEGNMKEIDRMIQECDKEQENKMSEADKMFEELGYEKEEYNPDVIYYTSNILNTIYFAFNKNTKKVCFIENNEAGDISMQELQAIYLKCKELGWI